MVGMPLSIGWSEIALRLGLSMLIGLALGLAASAGLMQLIRSMLYQTEPLDCVVLVVVGFVLLLVATAACIIPAWRASQLDPMRTLRA